MPVKVGHDGACLSPQHLEGKAKKIRSSKLALAAELVGGLFEACHTLSSRKRRGKAGRLVKRQAFLLETLTRSSGKWSYAICNSLFSRLILVNRLPLFFLSLA